MSRCHTAITRCQLDSATWWASSDGWAIGREGLTAAHAPRQVDVHISFAGAHTYCREHRMCRIELDASSDILFAYFIAGHAWPAAASRSRIAAVACRKERCACRRFLSHVWGWRALRLRSFITLRRRSSDARKDLALTAKESTHRFQRVAPMFERFAREWWPEPHALYRVTHHR